MKIAILGRQPSIGIAELESVFGGEKIRVLGDYACLIETEKLNVSHFGSILKTGQVAFEINSTDWREVSKKMTKIFEQDFSNFRGKITLGISTYGLKLRPNELSDLRDRNADNHHKGDNCDTGDDRAIRQRYRQ